MSVQTITYLPAEAFNGCPFLKHINLLHNPLYVLPADVFSQSLNTSLCEIYDHKAAFLVKTVVLKNFNLHIWKKRTDIIDLSYNIEECLAVNDYFTD